MVNWESNVFPGILGRTCDRPCEPACRRGRVEESTGGEARAGRDLPPEARRGRLQGRHPRALPQLVAAEERQAHRLRRRRAGIAHGRARSRAARLRGHRVRRRRQGRRLHPHADPALSPARGSDRRGDRLHPRSRRRVSRRHAHRLDEGAARRGLGRRLRRLRRAARPRPLDLPGRTEAAAHIHIGIDWLVVGLVRPRRRRSASASSCSAAATPRWTAAAARSASAAATSRSSCARGFEEMKASPWEKEDAMHEGIPILNCLVPKAFLHENGKLTGMSFEKVARRPRRRRAGASSCRPASPSRSSNATTCWSPSARRTRSRGSSATAASRSTNGACRCSTR